MEVPLVEFVGRQVEDRRKAHDVAPLRDVMGIPRRYHPRHPSHDANLPDAARARPRKNSKVSPEISGRTAGQPKPGYGCPRNPGWGVPGYSCMSFSSLRHTFDYPGGFAAIGEAPEALYKIARFGEADLETALAFVS